MAVKHLKTPIVEHNFNVAVMVIKKKTTSELVIENVNSIFVDQFKVDRHFIINRPITAVFNHFLDEWCEFINEVIERGTGISFKANLNQTPVIIECYQPLAGYCSCLIKKEFFVFQGYSQLIESNYDIVFEYLVNKKELSFLKMQSEYSDLLSSVMMDPINFPQDSILHIGDQETWTKMKESILSKGITDDVIRLLDNNGMYHWHKFTMTLVNKGSHNEAIFGFLKNINQEKKKELDLIRRAERDSLTNLYNRGTIEKLINDVLINDFDKKHGLIIFDIDNFRDINNLNGHFVGDIILLEIGKRLLSLFPTNSYVSRLGGDEFAIFIKDIKNREYLEQKVKQLKLVIQEVYVNSEKEFFLTSSIGAAMAPRDGNDFVTLYQKADLALYFSKAKGRNYYCLFDEADFCKADFKIEESWNNIINHNDTGIVNYLMHLINEEDSYSNIIQTILMMLTKKYNFSRSYIIEISEYDQSCRIRYSWEKEGIEPRRSNLETGTNDLNIHFQFFNKEGVYLIKSLDEVTIPYKKAFVSKGIKALAQFIINYQNKVIGIVGFEDCENERFFSTEEISSLKIVAQLLGIILKSARHYRQLIEKPFKISKADEIN